MAFEANLKTTDDSLISEELEGFFDSIDALKAEQKELSEEMKDRFNSFSTNTRVDIKALKKAYKYRCDVAVDAKRAEAREFEYSRLVEMLGGNTRKQETLL